MLNELIEQINIHKILINAPDRRTKMTSNNNFVNRPSKEKKMHIVLLAPRKAITEVR